jgi:uncharacterized protein (TIRG00374 family)
MDKKKIFFIFGIILVYLAIILYGDINEISKTFQTLKIEFIPIILGIIFASLFIKSLRQKVFLDEIGLNLSIKKNLQLYIFGMSLVATPGGSGNIIKSEILKQQHNFSRSKTVPIVLFERYHDLLSAVLILSALIALIFLLSASIVLVGSVTLLIFLTLLIYKPELIKKIQNKFKKIKFLNKIIPNEEFNKSIKILSKPKIFAKGILLSIPAWLVDAFGVYLIFLAFNQDFGFIITIEHYFTATLFGAISMIPGGFGVTDGSLVALIQSNGTDDSIASSIVLLVRLCTIWFATGLGILFMKFIFNKNS